MSAVPPGSNRSQIAKPDKSGNPEFLWNLTDHQFLSPVTLRMKLDVLPVIFVPGIMGSNLRSRESKQPVWRLDATMGQAVGLLWKLKGADAGERQRLLHPDRTEVDPAGGVPSHLPTIGTNHNIRGRGWGEVGETSYSSFLEWLEKTLNPDQHNPALWLDYYQDQTTISAPSEPGAIPKLFPGIRMGMKGQPFSAEKGFQPVTTDDLLKRSKFWMPVHAVGYNWLASNQDAAKTTLKPAIERIIKDNNKGIFSCQQVILVTHSMGGLVARACAQLPGMEDMIAGIVHGVMPATGAAVAYRRCKVGMWDETAIASLVIGKTGQDVTSVFAQAAGALQLLPSKDYRPNWLRVVQSTGSSLAKGQSGAQAWPSSDPYEEIYRVRDRWWGLIKEEWLSPKSGRPISWGDFSKNVSLAKSFHEELSGKYHKNTYAFYGADAANASFEHISWQLRPGNKPDAKGPPSFSHVLTMSPQEVRMDGENPEYVGGQHKYETTMSADGAPTTYEYETSYWELHCAKQDGAGDGTVPESSGRSPMVLGGAGVKQQFRLMGIEHEPAFKNNVARQATLYAIDKIAGTAKVST